MRQIGVFPHEITARQFSAVLASQQIEHSIDASFDPNEEKASYAIWVHDEDRLAEAAAILGRFHANPNSVEFVIAQPEPLSVNKAALEQEEERRRHRTPKLTIFWIFLCVLLFFMNAMQEAALKKAGFSQEQFLFTPIRFQLMYDIPPALETLEPSIQEGIANPDAIEAALENTPYWRGVFPWTIVKIMGGQEDLQGDTAFYKLKQGQIWRLFTPSLLHGGLLHIAFNMLWLWVLGKEIDPRIGLFRSILLTLSIGIVSNTVQYLMSGPFFLGYSGIVMGLAGFIWSRQRQAPWEGYPLKRSVLLFLALYVLAMVFLQIGSVFILITTQKVFFPNIANAAHLCGGLWGIWMGRLSFFGARGIRS